MMKDEQPAERIWSALKKTAAVEKGAVSHQQAVRRVRQIVSKEGGPGLPETALRFYADEYVRMVRERR